MISSEISDLESFIDSYVTLDEVGCFNLIK